MESQRTRRNFLRVSAVVGTGLVLSGCGGGSVANKEGQEKKPEENQMGGEVSATEDLMREHGILRRALLVYTAAATKLRTNPSAIPPDALQKTAKLFRAFGEEYHEKKLEEADIFPAVKQADGPAAGYPDILGSHHQRGREMTDYILAVTQAA